MVWTAKNSPQFARLVDGESDIDLAGIALEIASDRYPDLDAGRYQDRIATWGTRVARKFRPGMRLRERLVVVNGVLFGEEGFHGNRAAYFDPRNSYLNDVIDRRTGIPISLSLLYLAVATHAGLDVKGVSLPSHFVLRAGHEAATLFIDPFHDGEILDAAGCQELVARMAGRRLRLPPGALDPCPAPELFARALRNLKAIYASDEKHDAVIPVLRRLVALQPDVVAERRDLGIACLHAGRPREALASLEAYLSACPGAGDAPVAGAFLAEARRRIRAQH